MIVKTLLNYNPHFKFFPCREKHPLTTNGCKDASNNPYQLERWSKQHPGCQWGLATGRASNLLVLDVDPAKGGQDSLDELEAQYGSLGKPTVLTGSDGHHTYFHWDGELTVGKNFRPGLDYRGEGGYVICPPSIHHEGGKPYQWLTQPQTFPDAPTWLLDVIKASRVVRPKQEYKRLPGNLSEKQRQAREWLLNQPGSTQGQSKGADNYCCALAVSLLWDFDLVPSEAIEIFCEWGGKADNLDKHGNHWPWSEYELLRKLDWAEGRESEEGKRRGWRLRTIMPDVSYLYKSKVRIDELAPGLEDDTIKTSPTKEKQTMYTIKDLLQLPDTNFIVDDHLPENSLAVVCASYGSFKTFWAVDMGLSISTGLPFLGRWQTQQGNVLYLAGEGFSGYKGRCKAWMMEKYDNKIPENFILRPNRLDFGCKNNSGLKTLLKEVKGMKLSTIFIDTKARFFTGNENDGQDQGRFVADIDTIREVTGAAIFIVDHTPKYVRTVIRGHTALEAAADVIFNLVREDKKDLAEVRCNKMKDAEELETYTIKSHPVHVFPDHPKTKLQWSLVLNTTHEVVMSQEDKDKFREVYLSFEKGDTMAEAHQRWGGQKRAHLKTFRNLADILIKRDVIVPVTEQSGSRPATYAPVEWVE